MSDPAWRVLLARFMAAVSLKRKVRLRSHSRVSVPFTWGLVRPVVLMPVETESWSEDERSTALYHELSHIKRVDFLIMLLVRLSLAVYWLNPLTWVVFGALRREQEKACDELVLRAGIKPSTYAENLLRFRRRMGRGWSPAVALLGLFGKPQLSERLAAILKHRLNFSEVKMKTKLMLVCIVVLALVLIGMARPADSTTDKTPKAPKPPAATAAAPVSAAAPTAAEAPAAAAAPEAVEMPTSQTAPAAAEVQEEPEKEKKAKAATEPEEKAKIKKIIIEPKSGEKGQVEIIVTGGDKAVRKIIVDKPVVFIRTDSADKPILVTSDGKEIKLESGAEIRLEVRGGNWAMHKEGKVLKLDKGIAYYIAEPVPPELGIPVAIAEAAPPALTPPAAEPVPGVPIPPAAVAEPAAPEKPGKVVTYVTAPAHKHAEGDVPHVSIEESPEPDVVTVVEHSAVPGKTRKVVTWTAAPDKVSEPHAIWFGVSDKDLAQKLKQVREQLKQVKEKKLSLDEVDKSLAEIEESLKKHEVKLKDMAIAIGEPPARIGALPHAQAVAPHAEAVPLLPGVPVPPDKNLYIVKVNDKDKFEVIFVGKSGEISKDRFEKAVARIKKELPSGFTLEPMLEEESGKVTFTIKSAQPGTGEVNVVVEKLTKIIKDALKEEGPKK